MALALSWQTIGDVKWRTSPKGQGNSGAGVGGVQVHVLCGGGGQTPDTCAAPEVWLLQVTSRTDLIPGVQTAIWDKTHWQITESTPGWPSPVPSLKMSMEHRTPGPCQASTGAAAAIQVLWDSLKCLELLKTRKLYGFPQPWLPS